MSRWWEGRWVCVGENEGWVTCSMSNEHFSRSRLPNTFQAAYLSSGRQEEGRGGCLEDSDYTVSNTQGALRRSARHRRGWCHRTEFHSGASNATPRRDKGHQPAERSKTTATPRGCFFSQTGSYRRGQASIIAQHAKQQGCTQTVWTHTSLNKGRLKFTLKFTLSSDI